MFKKLSLGVLFVMFSSFPIFSMAQTIVTDSTSTSTSSTSNYNKSDSSSTVKSPPPSAIAPAITTINNDICVVGASGAVQTQIFGMSFGTVSRDMNCERIKLSKNLFDMGMKVAAVATLCQDHRVFEAMIAAGTPCPVEGKIGVDAKEEWAKRNVFDSKSNTEKSSLGYYALQIPKPVQKEEVNNTGCSYTGDDPVVMARICGK